MQRVATQQSARNGREECAMALWPLRWLLITILQCDALQVYRNGVSVFKANAHAFPRSSRRHSASLPIVTGRLHILESRHGVLELFVNSQPVMMAP